MSGERFTVELEPEVRRWLEKLPADQCVTAEDHVDVLADHATVLGEPWTRHLGGPVRELRFSQSAGPEEGAVLNHFQWKTARTRALLGEQVIEDPGTVARLRFQSPAA